MDYQELSQMLPLGREGEMILGLKTTQDLMEVLGNPQDNIPTIHIAGTNGKGSTAAIIASILKEAGYKVGLYTSPSLFEFNDRIRINGQPIGDEEIRKYATDIRDYVLGKDIYFTEFELYTALAWMAFDANDCDISIIETGIGGRLDATNIIKQPEVSVITKISYDHIDVLGDTLEAIAGEKAGIIKPGAPVVYYPQETEATDVIVARAKELGSTYCTVDLEALSYELTNTRDQDFVYENETYTTHLLETHQILNSCMAIEAISILNDSNNWNISETALKTGVEKAGWPGRFEWMTENPDIVVDGSHNMDGITGLTENISRYFPDRPRVAIVGMLGDKDVSQALQMTMPHFDYAVTVQPDSDRAMPADKMAQTIVELGLLPEENVFSFGKDYAGALDKAVAIGETLVPDPMYCVFGSFYYIGEMREVIKKIFIESRDNNG